MSPWIRGDDFIYIQVTGIYIISEFFVMRYESTEMSFVAQNVLVVVLYVGTIR